jgi:hypothetical protein
MIMDDFFELRVAFYKFVDRMSRRSSRKTEKITDIRLAGSERTCPYVLTPYWVPSADTIFVSL